MGLGRLTGLLGADQGKDVRGAEQKRLGLIVQRLRGACGAIKEVRRAKAEETVVKAET